MATLTSLLRTLGAAALRRSSVLCVAVALVLFLPSLDTGFRVDDLGHQALLASHALGTGERQSTFAFCLDFWSWRANAQFASHEGYLRWGSPYALSWFADPDVKIHFFRPLTAWTLLVNYRLGGADPVGYHLLNLVLWLLLVAAVMALYHTLLPDSPERPLALLLAGLFFALDDVHVMTVSFIAARHGLLDVLLSVTSLVFYYRFRQAGGAHRLGLAVLALALAHFAGETAVTTIFWVVAYEVFVARDSIRKRILYSAPLVGSILGFVVFYTAAGYGTNASSWYLSPLDQPLDFLEALPERLPALLMGVLTMVPAELSHMNPGPTTVAGEVLALGLAALLAPYVWHRAHLRCVAAAVLGSLLFLSIVIPMNYKLLFPSAGTALLLGSFVAHSIHRLRTAPPGRWKAAGLWAVTVLLLLMHAVAAPYFTNFNLMAFQSMGRPDTRESWRQMVDWPEARETSDVYLLSSPGAWTSIFLPYRDFLLEKRWVRDYIPISFAAVDQEMTRLDPVTLRLRSAEGFLSGYFPRVMAAIVRRDPLLHQGERFERAGLTVIPDEVRDGNPRQLTVRFPRDLDDENVWLLAFDGTRTRRIPAPKIGETVRLSLRKGP